MSTANFSINTLIAAINDANIEAFQIKNDSIVSTSAKIGFFSRIINKLFGKSEKINQETRDRVYNACVSEMGKEAADKAAKEINFIQDATDPLLAKHAAEFILRCHRENLKIADKSQSTRIEKEIDIDKKVDIKKEFKEKWQPTANQRHGILAAMEREFNELQLRNSQPTPSTSEETLPVENQQNAAVADPLFTTPQKSQGHPRQTSASAVIATQNPTLTTTEPVRPATIEVKSAPMQPAADMETAATKHATSFQVVATEIKESPGMPLPRLTPTGNPAFAKTTAANEKFEVSSFNLADAEVNNTTINQNTALSTPNKNQNNTSITRKQNTPKNPRKSATQTKSSIGDTSIFFTQQSQAKVNTTSDQNIAPSSFKKNKNNPSPQNIQRTQKFAPQFQPPVINADQLSRQRPKVITLAQNPAPPTPLVKTARNRNNKSSSSSDT